MTRNSAWRTAELAAVGVLSFAVAAEAQNQMGGRNGQPWRGAGPQPCFGADDGVLKCPEAPKTYAIKAARLFDSNTGTERTNQTAVVSGDRITAVVPSAQGRIPAGAPAIE